jgi:methylglutaconyl-CoA hydratase
MRAMSYTTIHLDVAASVATLRLDRADVRNAFSDVMIAELDAALTALAARADVRVVVLASAGPVFSAGADLNWMRRMANYSRGENRADAAKLADMLLRLATLPQPTVARVQGDCYAGGLGLVAACDIAVAVDTAQFCLTEVRLGLIPATIGPHVVRAIGARQASRYFLTAETFTALMARELGLVHEVCAANDLDAVIERVTTHLCQASPSALTESKRLIRDLATLPIDANTAALTADRIADVRASADGREGVQAFLERRKPRWIRS